MTTPVPVPAPADRGVLDSPVALSAVLLCLAGAARGTSWLLWYSPLGQLFVWQADDVFGILHALALAAAALVFVPVLRRRPTRARRIATVTLIVFAVATLLPLLLVLVPSAPELTPALLLVGVLATAARLAGWVSALVTVRALRAAGRLDPRSAFVATLVIAAVGAAAVLDVVVGLLLPIQEVLLPLTTVTSAVMPAALLATGIVWALSTRRPRVDTRPFVTTTV